MKTYNIQQLSEELNTSIYTIRFWYECESKQLKSGSITEPYLPKPEKLQAQGRPRIWTEDQVQQLREYQSHIVKGRNGIYGFYTNPNHYNTRKYKKQMEALNATETTD